MQRNQIIVDETVNKPGRKPPDPVPTADLAGPQNSSRDHSAVDTAHDAAIASVVVGPDGKPMTLNDLPPANTKRWVVRRKAIVVFAVRAGLLNLEEACARYSLSVEEFLSWQRLIDSHGMRGLRTTRLQQYRKSRLRRRR